MGLFSRKESAAHTGRASSDEQLIELRSRARRRLMGAVVLVLAAIVVIPIMLTDSSVNEPEQVVSVIPSIIPPSEEQYRLSESLEPADSLATVSNTGDPGLIESPQPQTPTAPAVIEPPKVAVAPKPEPQPEVKPPVKPTPPKVEPKPAPAPKPAVERTDDGSLALALLEGRTQAPKPSTPPAAASGGSVVVQIAAYSSRADADGRRAKLIAAGVSNAYVESVTVSGKPAFRLRVGPFPSRQAAQAAQARLRSLGYDNSFISAK